MIFKKNIKQTTPEIDVCDSPGIVVVVNGWFVRLLHDGIPQRMFGSFAMPGHSPGLPLRLLIA